MRLAFLLVAGFCAALTVGNLPAGLSLTLDPASAILDWRLPRVIAAAAAGFGLGVAGCLAQRLFANPMASPEVLGVGGGVAVGLVVTLLLSPVTSAATQLAGAAVGAFAVMGLVLAFGRGHRFSPQRLLLIGIAVTALFDAAVLVFLALGDPRAGQVLAWLSGSTYRVTGGLAATVAAIGLLGFVAAAPLARWLDILPLGSDVAKGLGVPLRGVRLTLLVIASVTAAAAAVVVGPLSFAGLIAPHIAAMLGLRRALPQLAGSALAGALLVMSADWIGRTVFAPTELPAGILTSLLGASFLAIFAAARRRAQA